MGKTEAVSVSALENDFGCLTTSGHSMLHFGFYLYTEMSHVHPYILQNKSQDALWSFGFLVVLVYNKN